MWRPLFWIAAWAWLALTALLAAELRLVETASGGWLVPVTILVGLLALRRLFASPRGGAR